MNQLFKRTFKIFLAISLFFAIAASAAENIEPPPPPPQEKINVFAVVSENIEKSFKDAAAALKETEQIDSFPMQGFQVHCTLYMTQFPAGMQNEVLAKIESLASTTRQFEVKTTGLEITSGNWFFMNLDRNRNLQTLSDAVVELLSPMRAQSDFVPEWAKPFPNKVEYISKFGSPNVYDEFNPHLTFLAKAEIEKLNNFLKNHAESEFSKPITGKVIAIGAGIADRNGQIPEPWKIFPLQPAE
ncbi:MAG: 2'-5' RNA ligase family protein [Candidatus Rifleibacteriota bacterium]